jgi:hypothetical protein
MVVGAGTGILSSILGSGKEKEALRRQKKTALEQYRLGKEYSDRQYGINRLEARAQADIQQGRLDESVNQGADQFNLGLLSQAYGIQDAQIQTAMNTGASLAAEGMSGTRGNGAGALMRAYEEAGLDRNIDLQRQSNDLSLAGMLGQANDAMADIRRERESWDLGGYRYSQKQAQDDYNLAMAQLGQSNFDWQIDQADWGWLDLITGGLSGASSGLSLWNSWNTAQQYADEKKDAAGAADPGIASGLSTRSGNLNLALPIVNYDTLLDSSSAFTFSAGDLTSNPASFDTIFSDKYKTHFAAEENSLLGLGLWQGRY